MTASNWLVFWCIPRHFMQRLTHSINNEDMAWEENVGMRSQRLANQEARAGSMKPDLTISLSILRRGHGS